MTHYIGIDPGATGALACLSNGQLYLARFDKQDPTAILGVILEGIQYPKVAIEAVHAMPGQGVVSMFTFGRSYGELIGFLKAVKTPPVMYSPQTWHKILPESEGPKIAVKEFCEAMWGLERFIFPNCRVPHQGAMDAACIAEYHRMVCEGAIAAPQPKRKAKTLRPLRLLS